jgi:hypothetical protein
MCTLKEPCERAETAKKHEQAVDVSSFPFPLRFPLFVSADLWSNHDSDLAKSQSSCYPKMFGYQATIPSCSHVVTSQVLSEVMYRFSLPVSLFIDRNRIEIEKK